MARATKLKSGKWEVIVGRKVMLFWIDEDGIHSVEKAATEGKFIEHREEVLSFDDALDKSVHQLKLL